MYVFVCMPKSIASPAIAGEAAKQVPDSIVRIKESRSLFLKRPLPYSGVWQHLITLKDLRNWLQRHSEADFVSAEDASEQLPRVESDRVNMPLGLLNFGKEQVPPIMVPEAVLINPWGIKTWLQRKGISILVDNTNEFGAALTSPTPELGLKKGSSNTGQVGYLTNIDWEHLAGIGGFSTHTAMVSRYGIPASPMFGDQLSHSQEIYGGGGNVVLHLVYFYGEETLGHGRFDVAGGRIPLLLDFMANFAVTCTFMNNAFCGNPNAIADNTTHSSWADASWGGRMRWRPTDHIYFQIGAYLSQEGIYGNVQFRTGFKFNGADINGVAVPLEFGWEPILNQGSLPGHYKVGYILDTADHHDNYYDGDGGAFARSGKTPRINHGSWSAYMQVDQMIWHHPHHREDAGVIIFGNFVANSERTQTRAQQYEAGIIDRGFWVSRPQDTLGFAFAYDRVSGPISRSQQIQIQNGLPLLGGAYGIQKYAIVLELVYQYRLMRGVFLSPDVQYFFRPNAEKHLKDAVMVGFKSHVEIF